MFVPIIREKHTMMLKISPVNITIFIIFIISVISVVIYYNHLWSYRYLHSSPVDVLTYLFEFSVPSAAFSTGTSFLRFKKGLNSCSSSSSSSFFTSIFGSILSSYSSFLISVPFSSSTELSYSSLSVFNLFPLFISKKPFRNNLTNNQNHDSK